MSMENESKGSKILFNFLVAIVLVVIASIIKGCLK